MKMFKIEPEVAGEIGENSIISYKNNIIDEVKFLHFEFKGWLGDEILETSPCFIVSESIVNDILESNLKGCKFEDIEISKSEEFNEMYPNRYIPNFKRLIPLGAVSIFNDKIIENSGDDFCIEDKVNLVISDSALKILKKHKIDNCDITILI